MYIQVEHYDMHGIRYTHTQKQTNMDTDDDTTTGTTLDEDDTEQGDVQDDAALLDDPQASGCGCSASPTAPAAFFWLLPLFAASARRR